VELALMQTFHFHNPWAGPAINPVGLLVRGIKTNLCLSNPDLLQNQCSRKAFEDKSLSINQHTSQRYLEEPISSTMEMPFCWNPSKSWPPMSLQQMVIDFKYPSYVQRHLRTNVFWLWLWTHFKNGRVCSSGQAAGFEEKSDQLAAKVLREIMTILQNQ